MANKGDEIRPDTNEYIDGKGDSFNLKRINTKTFGDGDSCSKRTKTNAGERSDYVSKNNPDVDLFVSFLKEKIKADSLRRVLEVFSLGANFMTLCSLHIDNCNASSNLGFREAGATLTFSKYKTTEVIPSNKLFRIGDIFTVGLSVLHKFLRHEKPVVPEDSVMRTALANLIKFVSIPGYLEDHAALHEPFADEGELAVKLAQHLLIPLAVASTYTMDNGYQFLKAKVASGQCVCKGHDKLLGKLGDTSFGCRFWHGRVDILLDDVVPVSITGEEEFEENELDEHEDDHSSVSSSIEVKTSEKFTEKDIKQILAETIVFSFLQQKESKQKKDLKSTLVPGIGISKKKLKVVFYDSVEDVLLTTPSLDLLDVDRPHLTAVVLLWLTLNYKFFCSGVTEEMKSFKADFFKRISMDVLETYKNVITMPYHQTKPEHEEDDSQWANHIIFDENIFQDTDDTGFIPLPM